jgi:predicted nucleic acid-binding protein
VTAGPPIVVDASVMLAWVLDEPEAPEIKAALLTWRSSRRVLLVPAHFWLEVINRIRRVPGTHGERMLATVHRLDSFGIQTVDPSRPMLIQVIDRVERHGLTPYDATYLALAETVGGQLATLDRTLATAAGSRAITFGDGRRLHETPAVYEHDVTWPNYKQASAYLARLRAESLADSTATATGGSAPR